MSDLLGKTTADEIKVLVDREGPIIYFSSLNNNLIEGVILDPSDITKLILNGNSVQLTEVLIDVRSDDLYPEDMPPCPLYVFQYFFSSLEQKKGILHFIAEDSLENKTSGSVFIKEKFQANSKPIQVAMNGNLPLKLAVRRTFDPIQINVSWEDKYIPQETFYDEICLQVSILSHKDIEEIYINDEPIFSIYSLSWDKLFAYIVKKYFDQNRGRQFLFPRMIKLGEGLNTIRVSVLDRSGKRTEEEVTIKRNIKQIHKIKERWRMAVLPAGDKSYERENTYLARQLKEALVKQRRFNVIPLEELDIILDEKIMKYLLDNENQEGSEPLNNRIDVIFKCHNEKTADSYSLSGRLIDIETSEVLDDVDVFVYHAGLHSDPNQFMHSCCALSTKLKEHFPLCEGKVYDVRDIELETDICINDGLKRAMKLLIYEDRNQDGDIEIVREAKVEEVMELYSLARMLEKKRDRSMMENTVQWGVITR